MARAVCLAVAALGFFACGESRLTPEVGSETHFLDGCDTSCPGGAECVCGICTEVCSSDASCSALGKGSSCVSVAPRVAEGRCAAGAPAAVCDVGCVVASDCTALGDGFRCVAGYCRNEPGAAPAEPETCALTPLAGDDIVVLGDALFELTHFAEDVASAGADAGAVATGAVVRDYSSHLYSLLASGTLGIGNQWATAKGDGPARLVIMNGGATDVLSVPCGSTPQPDCPAIRAAVAGAEELFATLAADGVGSVVYAFYADFIGVPDVKAGIDTLRPLVANACGHAPLPCYFIDLRPTFDGHPEYTGADGIVISEAGATATAGAVVATSVARCVAWQP